MNEDQLKYKEAYKISRQSRFGYGVEVDIRCRGKCQLCGFGELPINFDVWRQMTVEHIIGEKQGGYLKDIRKAVAEKFKKPTPTQREDLSQRLHKANTVTACSFCNSTPSNHSNHKSMPELIAEAAEATDDHDRFVRKVSDELSKILKQKKEVVQWKLKSIRKAFDAEIKPKFNG